MSKKRVLFVGAFASYMKSGGSGGQIYACRSLLNSNLITDFDFITIDSTAPSNEKYFLIHRLFNAFKRLFLFISHITFQRIDTVLLFTADGLSIIEKGTMLLIGKLYGKKVIIAPRSGFILNDFKSKVFRLFIKYIFLKSDFVICQSEYWKSSFLSLYSGKIDSEKFQIIHNWIDTSIYADVAKKKLSFSRIENNKICILYLAWVDKAKGIYDLIYAIKALSLEFQNFKVIIAGKGKDFENSIRVVSDLNLEEYFIFTGWINSSQKLDIFLQSDIYVLPSYFEGSPNSLLEAMSCGIASISTNVGSIPDILNSIPNKFIYTPGDIKTLQNYIYILCTDIKARVGLQSQLFNRVLQSHSLDYAVVKFKKIL